LVVPSVKQVPLTQQPVVQLVLSQTHAPAALQCWPETQVTVHVPPTGPQKALVIGERQRLGVPPQQPVQLAASQTHAWLVPSHLLPVPHDWQTTPPVPHAPLSLPVLQVPLIFTVQQPLAQLSALHSHVQVPASFTQR
jgi:hypothetical protein